MWNLASGMHRSSFVLAAALCSAAATQAAGQTAPPFPTPPSSSPAGPLAYSCGVPPLEPGAKPDQAIFPAGQYPVSLPATSLLGARNDLPNPYQPAVDFGQLPAGRKWGSTASVTTAPDNTIWVIDRCGNSG